MCYYSFVNAKECLEEYADNRNRYENLIKNNIAICAQDKNRVKRSDACTGDSGGPLLIKGMKSNVLIGVVSFAKFCGTAPGIYTSIYDHLDWIESVVWPDQKLSW